ncbi:hypothetical protein U1737_19360 [Sphingomonas sp. LB3N6]|uniref:hypothetical protein n=1 Tax=Sphingomonas fucosidasi TaxID=3096164 RepID=UPI002FCC3FE4
MALRRAVWGSGFAAPGTIAYYAAYAYIAWRAVTGSISSGDLTVLAASFLRPRGLLEGLLTGFSSTPGQALYIDDLFYFFRTEPGIRSSEERCHSPIPFAKAFSSRR